MKTNLKKISVIALSAAILTACNSGGVTKQTDINKQMMKFGDDATSQTFYSLGSGYVKKTELLTSSNSIIDINDEDAIVATNPSSSVVFNSSNSSSSIIKKLGIDGSIKGKYQEASGEIAASFLDEDKANEQSFDYYLGYSAGVDVKLKNKYLVDFQDDASPDVSIYGDSYINSLRMGIGAFLKISISSNSKEAIQLIKGSLKGSYSDLVGLDVALDKLDSNIKSSIKVTVSALQVGGDVDKLLPSIGTDVDEKADGYGLYNCSLSESGINSCNKILTNFEKYAKDTQSGLAYQVKTYVNGLTRGSHTYGEVKTLFPIDNSLSGLSSKAGGIYYNSKNPTQSSSTKTIDTSYLTALSNANKAYTERLNTLDELLAIKSLSGGVWNIAKIGEYQKKLVTSADELYNFTTSQCMGSSVLSDNDAQQNCINTINTYLADTVVNDYKADVKDKFKGFRIFTTASNGNTYQEFLLPDVDSNGIVSFVDVISPLNLSFAKFNPFGTWTIANGNLNLSPYAFSVLPDLNSQQYKPSSSGLSATLDATGKTLTLKGAIKRDKGSDVDSNTQLDIDMTSSLTAIPTN